ncbi:hypothetical protein [Haliscomenobacter hydrossis]|uniref:Secretion system C-terminal sorting domain-containing protein n=1 Tax=Haliscomenobacter hydrossis (strain ATCC 27775 / DSM 1100 / LMG 10767 / O) TaxID=760192 RepID=F4L3A2_HALH1|nr:hypothetical protein [Haliscomenobacter hydrossis]AEE51736.1 hypothetical protein Halhy_3885 [Haliscomenobacter hydrossis DSM 1100]
MKDILKTTTRFALLLVLFVLPKAMQAKDSPFISINSIGSEKKVSLVLKNLTTPTTIRLESALEGILLEEEVTNSDYARVLNLNELSTGNYTLTISTSTRETEQPLSITRTGLSLNINERKQFYAPSIKANGNLVDVSLLNNQLTSLRMKIEDAEGILVFEDEVRNVVKLEKRYNLSKLPAGEYTIILQVGEKSYLKTIRK